MELNPDGSGPEAGWDIVYHRRSADTKLMSATASPGRTWIIFVAKRRVPVLAPAAAAAFLHGGGGVAGLSGLGGVPSPACHADVGDQDYSLGQLGAERRAYRGLGRALDSVSVKQLLPVIEDQ